MLRQAAPGGTGEGHIDYQENMIQARSCAASVQRMRALCESRDVVQGTRYRLSVPLGMAVDPALSKMRRGAISWGESD